MNVRWSRGFVGGRAGEKRSLRPPEESNHGSGPAWVLARSADDPARPESRQVPRGLAGATGARAPWYYRSPATVCSWMLTTSVGTKSPDRSQWSGSPWCSRSVLVPAQPRTCPRGVFGVRPCGRALGAGRQHAARAEAAGRRDGARAVALIPYSPTRH